MERLWFFKSSGSDATYGDGKGWYNDVISKQYEFDNKVANSQQIKEGDKVLIFDKIKALGQAKVVKLEKWPCKKNIYRCPHCDNTTFDRRRTKTPEYKCGKCKKEFDEPVIEEIDINKYRVSYGDTFKVINDEILITSLKDGTKYFVKNYNRNMSIQALSTDILNDYNLNNILNENGEMNNYSNKSFINIFLDDLEISNLFYHKLLTTRFISSLISKPFVLLSGLSGSGKTKLAQSFATWICEDETQYEIVAVGADWTNREPLLGYPNALNSEEYIKPDNGTLDLIIKANENLDKPYFLILDEMNLSHVERYFADFLSAMESKDSIKLHALNTIEGVPDRISLPSNLFIIGTVNIDETTYMFSPKVLDRANVIEFRLDENDIENFFNLKGGVNIELLKEAGKDYASDFIKKLNDDYTTESENVKDILIHFFRVLKKVGAEFGYRTAGEISKLTAVLKSLDDSISFDSQIDIAIMQKVLPKLHGSRRKLVPVLLELGKLCTKNSADIEDFEDLSKLEVKYPISFEKLQRMYQNVIDNGFASYAEA
ncbi:hypothetical protein [Flammeovirga pacifica]|uniref:AAA+ ATPase domain-containing protein n=1 Tax=Flammeovirga pacifica TaxID=915059 RepID=A0A1S1YVQ1_FLAPC|nr:hypothetical protein [Flammeovirga pacifica]OHX65106.1 hypothetical protein NH26_01430 [Flammeovirga pacifica]